MHFRLQAFNVAEELLLELLRALFLPMPYDDQCGGIESSIGAAAALDGFTAKAALKLKGKPLVTQMTFAHGLKGIRPQFSVVDHLCARWLERSHALPRR